MKGQKTLSPPKKNTPQKGVLQIGFVSRTAPGANSVLFPQLPLKRLQPIYSTPYYFLFKVPRILHALSPSCPLQVRQEFIKQHKEDMLTTSIH